ncbi:MAG: hypothetical protein AAGA30_02415 [Planctomycetota bacterium]
MIKNLLVFALITSFSFASPLSSQESDLDEMAEQMEAMARHLGEQMEGVGEDVEELSAQFEGELEQWSEKYSRQWEEWAEKFESKFERWAQDQERVWARWAEEYGEKWDRWSEEFDFDEGEFDPEKLGRLIERNMEMLGDMPVGDLIEGMVSEGKDVFDTAPWESLEDLQLMLKDSIKNSVEETERRLSEAQEKNLRRHERMKVADQAEEFILPVIESQQEALRAKEKILSDKANAKYKKLERMLKQSDLDAEEIQKVFRMIERRQLQEKQKAKDLKKVESIKRAAMVKKEVELAREAAKLRLSEAVQKARQSAIKEQREVEAQKNQLNQMLDLLQADEAKLQNKNRELEDLKKQIEVLRSDIEAMKRSGK